MAKFIQFENNKDKRIVEIKDIVVKITDNDQLEFKGKVLSFKSNLNKKCNNYNRVNKIKEGIAVNIIDRMNKKEDK